MKTFFSLWRGVIKIRETPSLAFLEEICAVVAARHGLSPAEIKGPWKDRYIIPARFEFYAEAHANGFSYPTIGRFCGGRDHTTALSGARKHTIHRHVNSEDRVGDRLTSAQP